MIRIIFLILVMLFSGGASRPDAAKHVPVLLVKIGEGFLPISSSGEFFPAMKYEVYNEDGRMSFSMEIEDRQLVIRLLMETSWKADGDVFYFRQSRDGMLTSHFYKRPGIHTGRTLNELFRKSPELELGIIELMNRIGQLDYYTSDDFLNMQLANTGKLQISSFGIDIRSLIDKLDDEDWRIREKASDALMSKGVKVVARLQRIQKSDLTPEQAARISGLAGQMKMIPEVALRRLRSVMEEE